MLFTLSGICPGGLIGTSISANNFNSTFATVSTVLLQPLNCFYFCSMYSFPVQLLLDFGISWFNAAAINNCFWPAKRKIHDFRVGRKTFQARLLCKPTLDYLQLLSNVQGSKFSQLQNCTIWKLLVCFNSIEKINQKRLGLVLTCTRCLCLLIPFLMKKASSV